MELRRARPGDADAVGDIYLAAYATLDFLPRLHTDEQTRAFLRERMLVRDEVWLAVLGGRPVGFAAVSERMLEQLYVHPDAQGRGAGGALLERAKARRQEGFELWVFQRNERARRFYEARGCRLVRLTDGSGNEERTPDALYEWRPGYDPEPRGRAGGRL